MYVPVLVFVCRSTTDPSQPQDLRAAVQQVLSEPVIVVSWKEPAERNGEIEEMIVYYRQPYW